MGSRAMTSTDKVFIVDDDATFARALSRFIRAAGWAVEVYSSAADFLEHGHVDEGSCGCVLLDVKMPGMKGPELYRAMLDRKMTVPVVFLTGHGDVPTSVDAMKLGAVDFLEKPWKDEDLLDRVRRAIARDAELREERGKLAEAKSRIDRLTPRERDILNLVLQGKSSREIAETIFRTEKTVEFHRRNILKKLGIKRTVQLRQLLGDLPVPARRR